MWRCVKKLQQAKPFFLTNQKFCKESGFLKKEIFFRVKSYVGTMRSICGRSVSLKMKSAGNRDIFLL